MLKFEISYFESVKTQFLDNFEASIFGKIAILVVQILQKSNFEYFFNFKTPQKLQYAS